MGEDDEFMTLLGEHWKQNGEPTSTQSRVKQKNSYVCHKAVKLNYLSRVWRLVVEVRRAEADKVHG